MGLEVETQAWRHLVGVRRVGDGPGGGYPGMEALGWGKESG